MVECPACHYTGGHAANCPSQLATPQQRVKRAAHLFRCYYPDAAKQHCHNDGLSELEIESGAKLAGVQKYHDQLIRSIYGDPAFGSYRVRPEHLQAKAEAEQKVMDEHLSKLEPGRKPNLFEQLTLEEQLFVSTQLVNFRKGRVA